MELVWEDGDHDDNIEYFKGVLKAYQNYKDNFQNVGFQESIVKTKKFLATARESNTPRARATYIKTLGVFSDEYILHRATSAVNHIFSRKFIDQQQKDSELTVENFVKQQLSRVSSVPSFIPSLQKSLENDMEREKIPKNRKWLAGRWDRLKKKHGYDLKYFLNKFKESFKEKGIDPQIKISKEEDNEEVIVEAVEEEEKVNAEDYHTITFALRKILKQQIDYSTFKGILEDHQKISTSITNSMHHLLEVITVMILNGEFEAVCSSITDNDGNEVVPTQFFNFDDLHIENLKVKIEDKIAMINQEMLLSSKGLFTFGHFYQIFSCCIGDKKTIARTP
jgi:hypothetical protein